MMTDNTATQRRNASASGDAAASAPASNTGSTSTSNSNTPASAMLLPLRILSKTPEIITILLRVLLWPFFKLVNTAFPPKEFDGINNSAASDRAARAFVAMFQKHISVVRPAMLTNGAGGTNNEEVQEHYVEPACPFSSRGYFATLSEITARPQNTRPLLLVYLHSPLHSDGTKFIREYLCYSQLLQLLNSNNSDTHGSVACFGASVHTADGQKMRDMLGVNSFPFMALLSVKSSSSSSSSANNNNGNNNNVTTELLLRMEGPQLMTIPPSQITTYLNTSITRQAEILAQEEARRIQREEDSRLREEQNREFQETLLADQMREMERQEVADRERREREEREEAERLKEAQEESVLEDARAVIESAPEPPVGTKQGMTRLRFTLPNGKKVDRRFRSLEDTIATIRAFLTVHFHEQGIEMKNFGLSTNFPRKSFNEEEDNALTLEGSGLAPQAVVMVQDLDA